MADLIQKLLDSIDMNALMNILIAALAAWLGVPVLKDKIPFVRKLLGGNVADDLAAGFAALRELDGIHERQGISADERQRLFVEGVRRIVAKASATEAAK